MSTATQTWTLTPERIAQGFTSQAQLTAFGICHEHRQGCATCQGTGGWTETSDGGWQPLAAECAEHRALWATYHRFCPWAKGA